MSINSPKLLSGRVPVTPYSNLTSDRYQFLGLNQAEPSLGAGAANSVLTLSTGNARVWSNSLTLNSINVTGNVTFSNANITGNLAVGNISSVTNITGTGDIVIGNVYANSGTIRAALLTGTLTTNLQPNITQVGTLTNLSITGDTTSSGNIYANSGTIRGALLTGTITTNVQPNITQVGLLSNLTIGNASANTIFGNGTITAIGNIQSNDTIYTNALSSIALSGITLTAAGTNSNIDLVTNGTGNINLTPNTSITGLTYTPVNPGDAASKNYVDTVAQGLSVKDPVLLATTTALPAYTYNNGSSGVGATITANTVGALSIDSTLATANTRVLIKNETSTSAPYNGIYLVTIAGNATANFKLTRTLDFDSANSNISGSFTFVEQGTINKSTGWVCTTPPPVAFGSTNITFSQFSGAGTYTAGTGLTLTGTQFSITDTTVVSGTYGNGDAVATFTVNPQGQLTAASNTYITANAANLTGTTLASSIVNSSLTSVGTLGTLTVTANILAGNVYANSGRIGASLLTGTLTTAAQPNITSVGTLSSLAVTTDITAGNVYANAGNIRAALLTGTLTTASQPNITSVGTLTNLSINGNVTSGNVYANSGTIGASLLTGTLTTSAQPNITSVGTLTALNVAGKSNIGPIGNVTITGGTTGQVLQTDGTGNLSWLTEWQLANNGYSLQLDNSGNLSLLDTHVSGGALYFNGYDNITLSPGVQLGGAAGSDAFTVELWFRINSGYTDSYGLIGPDTSGIGSLGARQYSGGRYITFDAGTGSTDFIYAQGSITPLVWHYLVFVRDSSYNCQVFLDGVACTSGIKHIPDSLTGYTTEIGGWIDGQWANEALHGYIGGVKITVGSNLYSPSASTIPVPSTFTFTNTTGTVLLINTTNSSTAFTDATGNNTITGSASFVELSTIFEFGTFGILFPDGTVQATAYTGQNQIFNGNSNVSIPYADGDVTISASGSANVLVVNSTGVLVNNLVVYETSDLGSVGNVYIAGGTSGQYLQTNGSGNLSWADINSVANGNSNVSIPAANGNVNISAVGNANVLVVTGTGANITGTINVTGNANVGNLGTSTAVITTGNITTINSRLMQNGNSNVTIAANGNITLNAVGGARIIATSSGANVTGTLNVSGNAVAGNISGGNLISANYLQGVITAAASSQPNITTVGTLGNLTVSSNITAGNIYANTGNANIANLVVNGILTAANVTVNRLSNGNSNITILANGNINISSAGNANVVTVTGTGANINGTANITGLVYATSFVPSTLTVNTTPSGSTTLLANSAAYLIVSGAYGWTVNLPLESTLILGQSYTINNNTNAGVVVKNNAGTALFTVPSGGITQFIYDGVSGTNNWDYHSFLPYEYSAGGNLLQLGNSTTEVDLSVYGNITVQSGYLYIGNATGLTNIPGANVTGTLSIPTTSYAATVSSNAQPNITSVGVLTNLTVGNSTSNTVFGNGTINALGSIQSNASLFANAVTSIGSNGITITALGTNTDINLVTNGTGNISLTPNTYITNVANPINSQDAATKYYVDTTAQGLNVKDSVTLASVTFLPAYTYYNGTGGVGATITGNANGALSLDSTATTANARVLIKSETDANLAGSSAYNGIYSVTQTGNLTSTYILTRTSDFDLNTEIAGGFVFVTGGVTEASTGWVCTTTPPITIGTTPITFTQFSGAGTYQAGTGLTLSGTTFSISNTTVTSGSYGSGDQVATFTVNPQGQLTAASNVSITANAANLIGTTLASGIVTASLTSVGLLSNLTVGNATANTVFGNGTITATGNANVGNLSFGSGAIEGIGNITGGNIIGIIAAGSNTITTTGNITGGNANLGNLVQANFATVTLTTTAANQSNITTIGTLTSLNVGGTSNLGPVGNVTITGGTSGQYLQTNGSGVLTWSAIPVSNSIANGASNVSIPTTNGNVNIWTNGTQHWVFDTTGNLTTPSGILIDSSSNISNANVVTANYLVSSAGCVVVGTSSIAVSGTDAGIFVGTIANINIGLSANVTLGSSTGLVTVKNNLVANGNITATNTIQAANIAVGDLYSSRAPVSVGLGNVIVDQFLATAYRSAKYTVKAGSDNGYQALEVLLVHDGINSYITVYGSLSTSGSDLVILTGTISGGYVELYALGLYANTVVNLMGTYVPD